MVRNLLVEVFIVGVMLGTIMTDGLWSHTPVEYFGAGAIMLLLFLALAYARKES